MACFARRRGHQVSAGRESMRGMGPGFRFSGLPRSDVLSPPRCIIFFAFLEKVCTSRLSKPRWFQGQEAIAAAAALGWRVTNVEEGGRL